MHIHLRRRSILFAGLLVLIPASWGRRGTPAIPAVVDDALLADAVAFIERRYVRHGRRVVYNPVSTMQREFGLGFQAGESLVKALERAQVWLVCSTSAGRQAILGQNWTASSATAPDQPK